MRRLTLLLALGLVAGLLAYAAVRALYPPPRATAGSGADITWLRREFALDEERFSRIAALHAAYAVTCAAHCADIVAAQDRLAALRAADAGPGELADAERALRELEAVCNDATRVHIHAVADLMPPAQGRRYLALIEPHLAELPHDGDRGLRR